MKKKRLIVIVSIVLLYIVLLLVLVAAELRTGVSADGEPLYSIGSFTDALWYMLVTFTTVGYGDMTPVSPVGRFIGMIFMISSTGLLVLFINMILSWMMGDLAPRFLIWKHRRDPWVVLSSFGEEARSFVDDIVKDETAVFFICNGEKPADNMSGSFDHLKIAFLKAPVSAILDKHRGEKMCTVLLIDEDKYLNYETALHIRPAENTRIICKTDETPDELDPKITLFDEDDCLARYYWQTFPVEENETDIIIIGGGAPVDRILERALLINVFPKQKGICYHVFDYRGTFRDDHREIMSYLDGDLTKDSMVFHEGTWQEDTELLCSASRIILCDEDERCNLSVKNRIRRYHPVEGAVYLFHHAMEASDAVVVNRTRSVYSKKLLLSGAQNKLAVNINELYREKAGSGAPAWEDLSEFHRQANIAAADHLLTKVRVLLPEDNVKTLTKDICRKAYGRFCEADPAAKEIYRRLEHDRWERFYLMYNWTYDPVRDNSKRRHNLLVPFDELEEEERIKDDSAWQVLNEEIF